MIRTLAIEQLEPRIAPATVVGVDLTQLSKTGGFRIDGQSANENVGLTVSAAGDINGDGIADVIVASGGTGSAAYVVFGSDSGFPIDLSLGALDGTNGFKIVPE